MNIPFNIDDLTDEQKIIVMEQICNHLKNEIDVLPELVQFLDELDCDDAFGTEGWRHSFGFED